LSFNYGLIFNRINRLLQTDCRSAVPASAVIDIETLEVWKNQRECAEELGVSSACINKVLDLDSRTVRGRNLMRFADWMWWTDQEKEKHTRKNNIYFLRGEK